MKKQILFYFAILICLFKQGNAQAIVSQGGYEGKEFYVMYMPNSSGSTLSLYITSRYSGTVSISTPLIPGGLNTTVALTANVVSRVTVAATYGGVNMMLPGINLPATNAIHLTSTVPFTVYGLNNAGASLDSWLSIPVEQLGTEYLSVGFSGRAGSSFAYNGIIATEPGVTTINVSVPPGQTVQGKGSSFSINLLQGQSYLLQAGCASAAGCEMTGLRFNADKKIAVFGAGSSVEYPSDGNKGNYANCGGPLDHMCEQIPPVTAWGGTYVLPLWVLQGSDLVASSKVTTQGTFLRIVSAEPGSVTVNISGQPPIVLNGVGSFMDRMITQNCVINATSKITVYLIMASTCQISNTPSTGFGDAAFTCVAAAEQWGTDYNFMTPAVQVSIPSSPPNNYITIIKRSATGTVTLDGTAQTGFTQIPSTPYYVKAGITVATGNHRVLGDSALIVYTYGVQLAGTYSNQVSGSTLKNIILPVRFVSFSGKASDKNVSLNWKVAGEKDVINYIIERKNKEGFDLIDTVSAIGRTSQVIDYSYIDTKAPEGVNYYRIKQVDANGSGFYSGLISAGIFSQQNFIQSAMINNSGELEVMVNLEEPYAYELKLYNLQGNCIDILTKELEAGSNIVQSNVNQIPAGMYIIQLLKDGKPLHQYKVVKL